MDGGAANVPDWPHKKKIWLAATAQVGFDDKVLRDEPCTVCQRPIRTIDRGIFIESEYSDAKGRCWDCAREK